MSSFKIGIQTMGNKRHTLDVKDSDTVLDVKKKIETDLQIGPVDEQKLIYMGKILKDEQTLEAAKIKANDMLVVMIAKKKTAAPASSSSSSAAPPAGTPAATPAPAPAATPSTAPPSTPAPATTPATPAPAATAPSTTTPPANVAAAASSALLTGSAREEMVQNLMGLGFPRDQVEVALRAAFNNPDRAADYLFNGIPDSALAAAGIRPGGGAATTAAPATTAPGTAAPAATTAAPSTTGTAPAAGGGGAGLGGALGGLAGLGGAGGNEGDAIRQMIASNPQLIPLLLQQLAQTNPELVQQIQQNPGAFLQMLGASGALSGAGAGAGAGAGGAGRGGGRSHVIQITPEEKQSIDNLQAMGFDRNRALEAFLLCDRNEELAANYLFENAAQFAEEDREAAAHHAAGGGRGGGGDGGGDDGEEGDGEDFGDMPE